MASGCTSNAVIYITKNLPPASSEEHSPHSLRVLQTLIIQLHNQVCPLRPATNEQVSTGDRLGLWPTIILTLSSEETQNGRTNHLRGSLRDKYKKLLC